MDSEKIKVLIVEDEIITAMMISENLKCFGFEICDTAATGEDAIHKAIEMDPDIILMDIRLAGQIDGIEAAEKIRETKEIPVLFMTGYSNEEYMTRAQKVNARGFISKPVVIQNVVDTIQSITTSQ